VKASLLILVLASGALLAGCGGRTGLDDGDDGGEDASFDSPGPALDATSDRDASGDGGAPPSCVPDGPGTSSCGSAPETCCITLPVSGDTFYRAYASDDAGSPIGEVDPATVSAFRLDAFEVTVGRFRPFAAAWDAGYRPAPGSGKHAHLRGGLGLANSAAPGTYEAGWNPADEGSVAPTDANLGSCGAFSTWTSSPGPRDDLPLDCVTWAESYAFCIWDGGFLPSEAEWELAAAGGSQQREYPWGSADPGTQNRYAIYDCYFDPPDAQMFCNVMNLPGIAPVGTTTLGVARTGQLDLAGNVWEATLDAFAAFANPCDDCAYLVAGAAKVVKGGGFTSTAEEIQPPNRFELPQGTRNNYAGFRCARAP
jgi:formylglycine-generating enzyme required for sulfatase activity